MIETLDHPSLLIAWLDFDLHRRGDRLSFRQYFGEVLGAEDIAEGCLC